MDRGLAVVLTAVVGGLIALQAPLNAGLGRAIGTFQAAFLSFLLGTVVLMAIAAFADGGLGTTGEARHVAWYWLTGGILGAAYVTVALVTVRTLGVGGVTAATIAAQLAMSIAADHFGWFGVDREPVSLAKVAGVVLLGVGTWLVVRD